MCLIENNAKVQGILLAKHTHTHRKYGSGQYLPAACALYAVVISTPPPPIKGDLPQCISSGLAEWRRMTKNE